MVDRVSRGQLCLVPVSFRTTLPRSGGYHLESWMRLRETVRLAQLLNIMAQVPSIWAKGYMLDKCMYRYLS